MNELVILTGVSGAGKSTAIFFFEELGYQCIENSPVELIPNLLQLVQSNPKYEKTLLEVVKRGNIKLNFLSFLSFD